MYGQLGDRSALSGYSDLLVPCIRAGRFLADSGSAAGGGDPESDAGKTPARGTHFRLLPAKYLHGPPHPRGPGRRRFPWTTTPGRLVGSIGNMATTISAARRQRDQRSFLLQRAQPAMVGLIDGSLSTLAPIFAVAFATHQPRYAFLAGWRPRSVPASAWPSPKDSLTPAT